MQVINDSAGTYRSLTKAFREVVRNEGVRGLYQGMAPALFAASGSWGGYFYCYEHSKARKIRKNLQSGGSATLRTFDHVRIPPVNVLWWFNKLTGLSNISQLSSGVEAGVILVVLFNPVWVVKTRLALQGAETGMQVKYNGSIGESAVIIGRRCELRC